jgi:serine phosphatase RsbU (regulator of sigma subunit)
MTQLRNAGRTLAVAGYQPGRLLGELDRVAASMTAGYFATMAVAIMDAGASRLTYASAGHPPILIRRAETGTVETPAPANGPALGPFEGIAYTQGQTYFGPGDIVLMYTDGLIERRGEDIDDGIGRVRDELHTWRSGVPLGVLCEQLVTALTAQPQLDDICVLAACRSG